jgi:long-chain acyl-CoA synthetase
MRFELAGINTSCILMPFGGRPGSIWLMNLTGTSFAELQAALKRLGKTSIPELFAERVRDEPDKVAVRYKQGGVFRQLTWTAYREEIRAVAAGLIQQGLEPGARIAIMGDVCIEYLLADLAATFIGAIPCGIYPTSSPDEVAYVLRLVGARMFVAEDQEHLDRLLDAEAKENAPLVDKIIVCDERALFLYDDPRIELFGELARKGREDPDSAGHLIELEQRVRPDQASAIIFTSGTTGYPKAAYRTQSADIIGFGFSFLEVMPEMRKRPHRVVCQLPLAHGMGRAIAIYVPLMASMIPHIGEPNQSLPSLMNEVRPTYLMGVPRTWEKIVAHVQVAVDSAGVVARTAFAWSSAVGRRRVRQIWKHGRASWYLEAIYWPLWLTVIWPALHKLGLTYAVGACSGGASLPPVVHETVEAWGIPLRDMFGMTETGGIGAQVGKWPAPVSAITPMAACQVRASDDGELCLRGPGAIIGYWNDDAASKALFDSEGYVRSGDIATLFEGGAFRIVDRKKDILITSGGKNIAPATVENALRCSPYISEVIVFGDQRKYIAALIEIDFENVAQWARQRQIPYTGYMSLSQNEKVVQLIVQEVERLNQRLARVEQVKQFRILPKELVPEDGDTTPTRKVKRTHAYKLFGGIVEAMYVDDDAKDTVAT